MVPFAPLVWVLLAQTSTTPLTGTVVGPDGKPAAGALVVLTAVPYFGEVRVAASAKAADDGTFRLERPSKLAGEGPYLSPTLWAARPGSRPAYVRYPGSLPASGEPVTLKLGAPGSTPVRVVDPDGKPSAGARVRVVAANVEKDWLEPPDEVAETTEVTTGADGTAVVAAFAPREVTRLETRAPKFGLQPRAFVTPNGGPKVVELRPVGSVKGRFVAEGPADYAQWKIIAYTRPDDAANPSGRPTGVAVSGVDAGGRYAFSEVASGKLDFYVDWPDETAVIPAFPAQIPPVRAGEETVADLPLKRASTIAGRVVERGTGKPLENVKVAVRRPTEGSDAHGRTDADGKFWFASLPGKATLRVAGVPEGYVDLPWVKYDNIRVPEAPGRVDLEPVEVERAAPPWRGVVRDREGRPLAGLKIHANWPVSKQGQGGRLYDTRSDGEGVFLIKGVWPGAPVTIDAEGPGWALDQPVKVTVTGDEAPPFPIVVRSKPTVAVVGRVAGAGGVPVEGAVVRVWTLVDGKANQRKFQQIRFDDGDPRTGPDGTFRTPRELNPEDAQFRLDVTADGYAPAETPWVKAGDGASVVVPDVWLLKVRGSRSVPGRVVDPDGEPVRGATVFQAGNGPKRSQAKPDAEGRFRLGSVPEGPALVFAGAPGYRRGGAVVPAEPGPDGVVIRLTPEGRAAPRPAGAVAVLPRAEELALARSLLGPLLDGDRSEEFRARGESVIEALARVDPGRVLAMVEDRVLPQPAAALKQAVLGLNETQPGEALAVVEADRNPGSRAFLYLALAGEVPGADRARRVDLLDRALADARLERPGETKLQALGRVGLALLAAGEDVRAAGALREGKAAVAALAPNGWGFGVEAFGECLGVVDPDGASSIFSRTLFPNVSKPDASTLARHWVAVAERAAGRDPDLAERLLREHAGDPGLTDRDRSVLRAVAAIAAEDAPRARRLLDLLRVPTRPGIEVPDALPFYGLGLIAGAQAAGNPPLARVLLDEAFEGLEKLNRRLNLPASCVMAGLLPVVEKVDPDRLNERVWQAASRRHDWSSDADAVALGESAALAILIGPYDRALADAIFAPVAAMLPGLTHAAGRLSGYNQSPLFKAVAAYDPRAVRPVLDALPPADHRPVVGPNERTIPSVEDQFRLAAALTLGVPPDRRASAVLRHYFFASWPLDDRDD